MYSLQLVPGSDAITATYSGDGNYNGNTGNTVSHQVNQVGTQMTVTADHNVDGNAVGDPVAAAGTLTLGPLTNLTAGTHQVKADYSGAADYQASTGSITQMVANPHAPTITAALSRTVIRTGAGQLPRTGLRCAVQV